MPANGLNLSTRPRPVAPGKRARVFARRDPKMTRGESLSVRLRRWNGLRLRELERPGA